MGDIKICASVQNVEDTVCLPSRFAHFVLSATPTDQRNVLLLHNVLHSVEEATQLEQMAFNLCCNQRSRVFLGQKKGIWCDKKAVHSSEKVECFISGWS